MEHTYTKEQDKQKIGTAKVKHEVHLSKSEWQKISSSLLEEKNPNNENTTEMKWQR